MRFYAGLNFNCLNLSSGGSHKVAFFSSVSLYSLCLTLNPSLKYSTFVVLLCNLYRLTIEAYTLQTPIMPHANRTIVIVMTMKWRRAPDEVKVLDKSTTATSSFSQYRGFRACSSNPTSYPCLQTQVPSFQRPLIQLSAILVHQTDRLSGWKMPTILETELETNQKNIEE